MEDVKRRLASLLVSLLSVAFLSLNTALTSIAVAVSSQIRESQPAVRGVAQLVEKEPIKTVFTARLAPLLPIPIGGYNYVYGGLTGVRWRDFAIGTWLGGLKVRGRARVRLGATL